MLSNTAKKYLIAGVIATITITGALAYLQYKKLMNYIIKVKTAVVKTITANLLDLDLTLDFENKSNISFEIKSQEYEVYIDNKFITKINNIKPVFIKAKSNSDIFVNIKANPTKVGSKFKLEDLNKLLDLQNVKIKVIGKLKVKIYAFPVNIPFNYETTIKELRENK
jgi:LEA14-like dessication related protein